MTAVSLRPAKRPWHEPGSRAHLTGGCDPSYRRCRHCGDAHPAYIARCPMHPPAPTTVRRA